MDKNVLIIGVLIVTLVAIIGIVVVVIIVVKNNSQSSTTSAPTIGPPDHNKGDTLLPNQHLLPGDYLQSKNGVFIIKFGGKNNRLLTQADIPIPGAQDVDPKCIGQKLIMTSDGNLIVMNESQQVCWYAINSPQMPAKLILQDDGNLVILNTAKNYNIWSVNDSTYKGDTLYAGQSLGLGQYLQSKNRAYTAQLGGPVNRLVLSLGPALAERNGVEFNSNLGYTLDMQADGNLVVHGKDGIVCWAAIDIDKAPNTKILPGDDITRAFLPDTGNLTLYDANGNQWWSADTGVIDNNPKKTATPH